LDGRALFGIDAAGVGEHRVHRPAALLQPRHAEAGVEAAGEGEDDVVVARTRDPGPGTGGGDWHWQGGRKILSGEDGMTAWLCSGPASRRPRRANAATTAFCTCSWCSASSVAWPAGESTAAAVALSLRRSGRQWENTPSLVSAIFASS